MKRSLAATLTLPLLALALTSCKKDADAGPTEPTFTPGAIAKKTFEPLGVTLAVPDNVAADTSQAGKLTLTAPGFPSVTVSVGPKENGMGRMGSAGSSGVKMRLMGAESTWICESGPAGSSRKLIQDICDSMAPKSNPHVLEPKCDTLEGYDKSAVVGVVRAQEKALLGCLAKADAEKPGTVGLSLSFSASKQGGSYSSGASGEVANCLRDVYSAIAGDPVFKATEGKASCDVVVAAF